MNRDEDEIAKLEHRINETRKALHNNILRDIEDITEKKAERQMNDSLVKLFKEAATKEFASQKTEVKPISISKKLLDEEATPQELDQLAAD
jgi:hypothetical protein